MTEHLQSTKRRTLREHVMQALYAYEIAKDPLEHISETILGPLKERKADYDFAEELFLTTVNHHTDFDQIIKHKAVNWQFHRIALIDKLLLRMGICELMYFEDIPPKVSINEAIEIAKTYSTDKSGTFINGILDAVLIDLKKTGTLSKQGRGLLNSTGKRTPARPAETGKNEASL